MSINLIGKVLCKEKFFCYDKEEIRLGGKKMIYRTEHPKPQFMREDWINLNGKWQFEIDHGASGAKRGLFEENQTFSKEINVPFCPESRLSGIEYKDFMAAVWYKREFEITKEQLEKRIFLHFGAVDYKAVLYINGQEVGSHKGGYVSFAFEISDFVREGVNTLTLAAYDDSRDPLIPSGKQSSRYESYKCYYTRTTGIWQTVWLEFVPKNYVAKVKYFTDIESATLSIHASLVGEGTLKAKASFEGKDMGEATLSSKGGDAVLTLPLKEKHLWEVGKGGLYDLTLTYGEDKVESYFGLRSLRLDGKKFLINERSVFQRLILDQGFYPDGIYTAPDDKELLGDIERSVAMGFNGARLHEKIFEERFLYYCDKLGYIVWGEFPNWGLNHSMSDAIYGFLPEWLEEIDRDFNHPAIVGWAPFNETWPVLGRRQHDPLLEMAYRATKAADPTRPCIDTAGGWHVMTDIYDLHDYEQDPALFKAHYETLGTTNDFDFRFAYYKDQIPYDNKMPFFVSEYGGIRWTEDQEGWGYGNGPKTAEEFLERLKGLTDDILDDERMFGFCYTQLTDVEQEQNGLYTYDRKPKFDPKEIHKIFSRRAAIED